MKKMKSCIALLLTIVMCLSLASCSSGNKTENNSGTSTSNTTTNNTTTETKTETPTQELKDLPAMTYLYNQTGQHELIAEMLQDMWKQEIGVDVKLEVQEWAVLQTNRTEGNYQLSRHGWLGDYIDPMTFLDMFLSKSGQNDPKFKNAEYDSLIELAKNSADQSERMTAMHKAEELLMNDMPIIPLFHYTNIWLDNGKVKDSVFDPLLGNSFFMWASKADGSPIKYGIGASPKTLDPQLNNATDGATHVQSCFEGLTRKNKLNEVEPGVAKSWDVSEDGLTWTFNLRDNAIWSDGKPVTANDFVYAWQRAVDPVTACEYSYQLWYIKNGQAISDGEMPVTELAVKAINDLTLEVELEAPCGYFTQLTAFPTLYPVREDIVSSNPAWANAPNTYICNGPYKLVEFTPNDKIVFTKNTSYWDSANYPCPDLIVYLTDDASSLLSAFESGEMDLVEDFPVDETERLKEQGVYNVAALVGTYFIAINLESDLEALNDVRVRRALALSIDRDYLIETLGNAALPAYSFVPMGVPDVGGKQFKENSPNYFGSGDYEKDCQEARALLSEAGYKIP